MFLDKKKSIFRRITSVMVIATFFVTSVVPSSFVYAQVSPQSVLNLPVPGTIVPLSSNFEPLMLKGILLKPENPLDFDFLIENGDEQLNDIEFGTESKRLIKYFLASLTTPEDEMWVNLSPYEKDRIVPEEFGQTEMGRDLLAQDYILKQLSASLMYPEDELGQKFWERVYERAMNEFGTLEVPLNTFNKIWILPGYAQVYEHSKGAYVVDSHLKVMIEDYLALEHHTAEKASDVVLDEKSIISGVQSEIVRDIIIPEIENEVNNGKTFAKLRQVYNAVILASWYKQRVHDGILDKVYVDQHKTSGIDVEDKTINQKIYRQYVESFKKGVYDYIKEEYDPRTQQVIPRKYFSGGETMKGVDQAVLSDLKVAEEDGAIDLAMVSKDDNIRKVSVSFDAKTDKASAAKKPTMIKPDVASAIVNAGGEAIRSFLSELAGLKDNKDAIADPKIRDSKSVWKMVDRFEERPEDFTNESLVAEKTGTPRIEVRGKEGDGTTAQVAVIGLRGDYRTQFITAVESTLGEAGVSVKKGGTMTAEANMGGVDKALPLGYLAEHFDEILDEMGYTPGEFIDARKTRTVVAADGDGTTYGKPTKTTSPTLAESAAHKELLNYLEMGGLYVIISGNEVELTRDRLLAEQGIPQSLRNRVLVVANGSANFMTIQENGELNELVDYRNNALEERKEGKVEGLDVTYLSDDEKADGNDMSAIKKVGTERSITMSKKAVDDEGMPEELKQNYVGSLEVGTAAVLKHVNRAARKKPFQALFNPDQVLTYVEQARAEIDHAMTGSTYEEELRSEMERRYPTLKGNFNATENWYILTEMLGERRDATIENIAKNYNLTPELVIAGVLGQQLVDENGESLIKGGAEYEARMKELDVEKGFAGIISSSGGGGFSSNMMFELSQLDGDLKNRIMRVANNYERNRQGHFVAKNLVAVIDDGGRTGKLVRALKDERNWGIFVAPWGDFISLMTWGTPTDIIRLVYGDSNIYSKYNVNSATIDLIKEMIERGFGKEEPEVVEAIIREVEAGQKSGWYDNKKIQDIILNALVNAKGGNEDEARAAYADIVAKFVKDHLIFKGAHEFSLAEQFSGSRLRRVQQVEAGREFKKSVLKESPGFWWHATNIFNMARKYDESFVETGITPLNGISGLNAILQGGYELTGLYTPGQDGERATVNPNASLEKLHHAIGSTGVFIAPISLDESTQYSELEAASIRIKGSDGSVNTFLVGEGRDGKHYVRQLRFIQVGSLSMPITEHLDTEQAIEIVGETSVGGEAGIVVERASGSTTQYVTGHATKVNHQYTITLQSGEQFIIGEVEGDVGRTAVVKDGKIRQVGVLAHWDRLASLSTVEQQVEVKSRLILTQDQVTGNDVEEPHPVTPRMFGNRLRIQAINPNEADAEALQFYLGITEKQARAVEEYRKTNDAFERVEDILKVPGIGEATFAKIRERLVIGVSGVKSYDRYIEIPEGHYPKSSRQAKAIANQGHVFFTGKGSAITSVGANLVYPDFLDDLVGRRNIARAFLGKYKRDIEAAGLSLSEQYDLLERAAIKAGADLNDSDRRLMNYVAIPRVADNLRDKLIKDREVKAEKIRRAIEIGDTKAKLSKVPMDVQLVVVNINEANAQVLQLLPHVNEEEAAAIIKYREKGRLTDKEQVEEIPEIAALSDEVRGTIKEQIILEGVDDVQYFLNKGITPVIVNVEKTVSYNELQVIDLLTMMSERHTLLNMMTPEARKEFEDSQPVLEFRNEQLFWPISDWDNMFQAMSNQQAVLKIGDRTYDVPIPDAKMERSDKYVFALYVSRFIHNRLVIHGDSTSTIELEGSNEFGRLVRSIAERQLGEDVKLVEEGSIERLEDPEMRDENVAIKLGRDKVWVITEDRKIDISNMVNDMSLQGAKNNRGVAGAISEYISGDGIARLGKIILPGNLRNTDVTKHLSQILDKQMRPHERKALILKHRARRLMPEDDVILQSLLDTTAANMAKKIEGYHKNLGASVVIFPSSEELGLGVELGRVLANKIEKTLASKGIDLPIIVDDDFGASKVGALYEKGDVNAQKVVEVAGEYLATTLTAIQEVSNTRIIWSGAMEGIFLTPLGQAILREATSVLDESPEDNVSFQQASTQFGALPSNDRQKGTIHIVGPAASGKNTIAEKLAESLGTIVFNTGDRFRPYALKAIREMAWLKELAGEGNDVQLNRDSRTGKITVGETDVTERLDEELSALVDATELQYIIQKGVVRIIMDGEDVTQLIHSKEVGDNVSAISRVPGARKKMMANTKDAMQTMENLPLTIRAGRTYRSDAIARLFITADRSERARRAMMRQRQIAGQTGELSAEEEAELVDEHVDLISERDTADGILQLEKKYPGVYHSVDTTRMSQEEQIAFVLEYVEDALDAHKNEWEQRDNLLQSLLRERELNAGTGRVSLIMSKGGKSGLENSRVRAEVMQFLEKHFDVQPFRPRLGGKLEAIQRWKDPLLMQVQGRDGTGGLMKVEGVNAKSVKSLVSTINNRDPWRFERVLEELLTLHPDDVRVKKLNQLWGYVTKGKVRYNMLVRKSSRADIIQELSLTQEQIIQAVSKVDKDMAERFASGVIGEDALMAWLVESVDEQNFVKHFVVGATNPMKAGTKTVRGILARHMKTGGALVNVMKSGMESGFGEGTTATMFNGVHAPSAEELALEVSVLKMTDAKAIAEAVHEVVQDAVNYLAGSLKEEDKRPGIGDDQAMTSEEAKFGGIDLNPGNMNINIEKNGEGFHFDVKDHPLLHEDVNGFSPIITNVSPVINLPLLLGLDSKEDKSYDISMGKKKNAIPSDQAQLRALGKAKEAKVEEALANLSLEMI